MPGAGGLSALQTRTLLWALEETLRYEALYPKIVEREGIPWQPTEVMRDRRRAGPGGGWLTSTDQASISRSLARLEARKLLIRITQQALGFGNPGSRQRKTYRVQLTPDGRDLAERLSSLLNRSKINRG